MTPLFKAIPAILLLLLSMPLAAQSGKIALRVAFQNASGYLLHVGESGDPRYQGLQALLRSDELSEIVIAFGSVQTTSADYASLARELGMARDSRWALTDDRGRCILQGSKLPSAEEIQNALDAAGVKSPIKLLRDFLKQYPDHLDARRYLLEQLRTIAESRTRHALQLDIKYPFEIDSGQGTTGTTSFRIIFGGPVTVDTSPMEGKLLNPEQDIKIWGPYAQELQTLFASGDWKLINAPWFFRQLPVETCSPTMIQIYRRHIARVEAYLEEYPSNPDIWNFYNWMLAITKQNAGQSSIRALFDRIALLPYQSWPTEETLHLLISEERKKENWNFLAETLLSNWSKSRVSLYNSAESIEYDLKSDSPDMVDIAKFNIEDVWQKQINPLIESLIKTNRIAEAETIITDVSRFSVYRDFQRRSVELALSLDRRDIQTKWLALQIPEKPDEPDMDYLEAIFSFSGASIDPCLVMISAEESDKQLVDTMLRQGRLLDWRTYRAHLNPALSELLRQKEGWPDGVTYWALYGTKGKMLAHGAGLPTEEALYQALQQSNVETPANVLRRFIREHPSHFEAKGSLLQELKRIAEQRIRESLGGGAGVNTALMLNDEDDRAIWEEYASLYRLVIPYHLEQGRPRGSWQWDFDTCDSEYFIHSQTMKNLANVLLPQVEACLRRQPTDHFLLCAWISLSELVENRSFRHLVETLVLSPMNDSVALPHSTVTLMRRYSARSNWRRVIDFQEWRWEIMRAYPERLHEYEWLNGIQYLLEAYLRLEKNSEANELVRVWRQSPVSVWPQIKRSAVELAEKCGKDALAVQWKK